MRPAEWRRPGLTDRPFHYCPGCTHGLAQKLIGELLEEMNLLDRAVGVASVGCTVKAYDYFACDMQQAAHGRAPAVATGIKRVLPEAFVFTLQGDGDLASIGIGELCHAAARGEKITVVFVNNGIYGMTGGQMAPTTPLGFPTTTTPEGRGSKESGFPLDVVALLSSLPGVAYLARESLSSPARVLRAKRYLRRAFEIQEERKGFGLVELLSACNVGWGLEPVEALRYLEEKVVPLYTPGVFRDG